MKDLSLKLVEMEGEFAAWHAGVKANVFPIVYPPVTIIYLYLLQLLVAITYNIYIYSINRR